jgi:NADPH2:quinone reductase
MAKRIEFSRIGGPEVLNYVDYTPVRPEPNEILVENKAVGVNYIDTYYRGGLYPVAQFPSGLGSEGAGIVIQVGTEVTDIQVGDRVAYAQSPLGAYSQYQHVAADKAVILPDEISFEQAAASLLKGLTVYYLLQQTYPVKPGETILFHAAAGGVGLIACQWAKAMGVKLIGTVGSEEKAQLAKEAGAWATINYRQQDIAEQVLELTNGKKVSVVYDSVGKDTWLASLDSLMVRGLMVSFGNASGPVTNVDIGILNKKGCLYVTRPSLFGYITSKAILQTAADELFTLISSGAVNVNVPQQQIFALADVAQAHTLLESRATRGSCLLIP